MARANIRKWLLIGTIVLVAIIFLGILLRTKQDILAHTSAEQIAFSPDGQRLAVAADVVQIWHISDRRLLQIFGETKIGSAQKHGKAGTIAFSPDGQFLATGGWNDNNIYILRTDNGALVQTLVGHTDMVFSVAFSPDGMLLASASADTTVRLWNVHNAILLRTLRAHNAQVRTVVFSPDGQSLASGSVDPDGTVRLWRVDDGRLMHTFDYAIAPNGSRPTSIAYSPDGQWLAIGAGRFIHVIRLSDSTTHSTILAYNDTVNSVAFSPDSTLLASGGGDIDPEIEANGGKRDATVRLWRLSDGSLIQTLGTYRQPVVSVAFSPDGSTLAAAGIWGDGIRFFNVR